MTHEIVIVNSVMALGCIYQKHCKPEYMIKTIGTNGLCDLPWLAKLLGNAALNESLTESTD